jgi:hypothetical protein
MTLTVRSATVSGATTKGSALTHAELDENFNHLSQSSNHTFTPSGSGASSRTVQAKLRELGKSPEDFGATGDGSTDDTTAIQNWVNSVPASAGGTDPGWVLRPSAGAKYKLTDKITIGNRRIAFKGGGVAGSGSPSIFYQSVTNKDHFDFTTGNSDVVSFDGIMFLGPDSDGSGRALVLGSSGQACFDSRITNCWFVSIQDKAIEGVNLQGCHITNCAFDSSSATDEYGVYITKGSDNIIAFNRFYGQVGGGVVILEGENNQISDNHFDLCGGDNDTTGAILIDVNAGGTKVARATLISCNSFRANENDIVLDGNSGVNGSNTGCNDTHIVGNVSDRPYRRFLLATDAHQTRVVGNGLNGASQEGDATYPFISITGTCDGTYLEGNKCSESNSAARATYGLVLGASTTDTAIGSNVFAGKTGDVSIDASATLSEKSTYVQTGTWTPAVGGDATYTVQEGYYRKQGKLVFVYGKIVINVLGTGSVTTISGLPFTSKNATNASTGSGSVAYFASLASNVTFLSPVVNNNSAQMFFASIGAAGATATSVTNVFGDGARIDFTVTYLAAQ